jgi:hypothetical protein
MLGLPEGDVRLDGPGDQESRARGASARAGQHFGEEELGFYREGLPMAVSHVVLSDYPMCSHRLS